MNGHARALLAEAAGTFWFFFIGAGAIIADANGSGGGLGAIAAARLLWTRGDYARLVDAFGTVIDEIVVWPPESAPQKAEQPASPR